MYDVLYIDAKSLSIFLHRLHIVADFVYLFFRKVFSRSSLKLNIP